MFGYCPDMPAESTDIALREAIAHHRAGRLAQAEKQYRAILAQDPHCARALNMLGAIAYQVGRFEEGAKLIERAIELGLSTPEAFNNLGECLRCLHRIKEAAIAYRNAIKINPNHGEALSNLGMVMNDSRRYSDALPLLERAVKHRPDIANAQYNLGVTLANLGRLDDAIRHWQTALKIQPDHLLALKNLGLALREKERFDESLKVLKQLVEKHPKFAEGHADYGSVLAAAGQHEEAIAQGKLAVELALSRPEAHTALGYIYTQAGQNKEALSSARKAVRLNPTYHPAMITIAGIYRKMERYDEAGQWFDRVIEVDPTNIDGHTGVFDAFMQQNQPEKALESAERSLVKIPTDPHFHFNRATALLTIGRYAEGFEEYEFRSACKNFQSVMRKFDQPKWDGSNPNGRTIFIHVEQGFGDMFQFARYIPLVVASGAKVIVEVPWEVQSIFQSIPGVSQVIERKKVNTLPPFDLQIALGSLPWVYKSTLETIPTNLPYLQAHAAHVNRWKPRIDAHAKGMKVGIVWGGNTIPEPRRSCSLKEISALGDVPNISWYSLQVGEHRDQLKGAAQPMNILDLGKDFKDFSDTAAVLAQMDLLITIDTSAAHLAGAMNRRTWVMLPFVADWRWKLEGQTAPWYPSLRLFRQKLRGDWSMPIRQIREELLGVSPQRST